MRTYIVSFVILFVLPVGSGAWIVKRFASWLDDGLDTDSGDSSETGIPFVCANGGILATVGYFQVCFCAPGFTGHYCETKIGCGLACYNGGVCVKQVDLSEFCYCPPGFTGADCSVPIGCSLTCNNGGTCIKNADLLEFCSCPPGFTGSDCSTPIGCSLTCSNGGTCITNADLTEFCDCAPGFTGADCSTPIECSLTCNNGGTCITNADLTQFCDCAPGFTGADCSAAINYCDPNPCGPHATCQSKSFSHVYCACDQGYGGVNCSLSTSPTGESCTSDIDCSLGVKNSYCSKGLCYCQYGYRYVRDSTPNSFNPYNRRLCTLDCVEGKKLSTDTAQFIAWPANTAIEQDDGIILSNIPDVDACKQACIDNDANGLPCVTAEYLNSNQNCQLGFVRISDAGVSPVTVSSSLGMMAFERPCV